MRRLSVSCCEMGIAFLVAMHLVACHSTEILRSVSKKKETLPTSDSQKGASAETSQPKDAGTSEEADSADAADSTVIPPTPVGGSYLTCAVDFKAPPKDQMKAVACRLESDYKRVAIKAGVEPKFTLSPAVQSSYVASSNAEWDWLLYVPQSVDTLNTSIQVEVETVYGREVSAPKPLEDLSTYKPNETLQWQVAGAGGQSTTETTLYSSSNAVEIKLPMTATPTLLSAGTLEGDLIGQNITLEFTQGVKVNTCTYKFDTTYRLFIFQGCSDGRHYSSWFIPTTVKSKVGHITVDYRIDFKVPRYNPSLPSGP